jgi:16S rRNA processing protein RimM
MVNPDELVLLGKVTAPHGVRGYLRVFLFSGNADTLLSADAVVLKGTGGEKVYKLSDTKVHGKKVLVMFEGFDDINLVLPLVGQEIYVPKAQLPVLEEGEYYWHDLLGMKVYSVEDELLGELVEVVATGSNDVFVVRTTDGELFIPATEEVVKNLDFSRGIMRVELLEGLRDL